MSSVNWKTYLSEYESEICLQTNNQAEQDIEGVDYSLHQSAAFDMLTLTNSLRRGNTIHIK